MRGAGQPASDLVERGLSAGENVASDGAAAALGAAGEVALGVVTVDQPWQPGQHPGLHQPLQRQVPVEPALR